jgi:putative SOS response-associated peptidase YedK
MCGRFDTTGMSWVEIYNALKDWGRVVTDISDDNWADDVRPTTSQWTARLDGGAWVPERMRWGLVPFWRGGKPVKDSAKGAGDGFKLTTFNCKVENFEPGAKRSAVFADPFARRRCIVPASGWYEWTDEQGGKVKHRFSRRDGKPIWFAGLWDRCKTSDMGEIASFTIMTGPSAGSLSAYHSRAPVILDPDDWMLWLDPARDASPLFGAVRPERFDVREAA